MIVECPHVGIRELSEAWGVSARTVKEWLASAGIKTVVRGRYRVSDVTRYADQYGKPKLSNRERLEVMQLQKALDNANAEIAELQECRHYAVYDILTTQFKIGFDTFLQLIFDEFLTNVK
jgi:hypothetical protein